MLSLISRKHQAAALAVVVLLAGCSSSRPASQPSATLGMPMGTASPTGTTPVAGDQVSIENFAFAPAAVTVRAGSTVTWTNRDEEPHTVAANDGSFHSPGMGTGASFSQTFATPGTFDYVCSIHPSMHGTVVVTQ
ncbi:cupredoxin domain-containing protein [Mycobacterium szulgai]|uniref:Amidase n=1 Tax=Mycobacterium szulgai TaxID=1787 RepID=A0A1X2DXB4_MYCSZ|nr:cupredoxin family copper-binding protein [Mycobacterium szulgai]MCV7078772.1 cupredoxin family copper-binding protein [Mycobacterium szulgai]ORW92704.1 amidase [Mycobacterium szulgai]